MLAALEVAIGLAVLFLVLALASSSVIEVIGSAFKLRAAGLERAVRDMLGGDDARFAQAFVESRVIQGLRDTEQTWNLLGQPKRKLPAIEAPGGVPIRQADASQPEKARLVHRVSVESRRRLPAKLPARTFADGVVDVLTKIKAELPTENGVATLAADLRAKIPDQLWSRLEPMLDETKDDLVGLKARVEQWFDDTMLSLEDTYTKWSKKVLFLVGLVLAVSVNASAFHVADRLWGDSAEREAVVAAVDDLVQNRADQSADDSTAGTQSGDGGGSLSSIAAEVHELDSIGLPVGWDGVNFSWIWLVTSVLGWVVTALLVRLGAPFWYNVLTRMFSFMRSRNLSAGADPASATSQVTTVKAVGGADVSAPMAPGAIARPAGAAQNLLDALSART